MGMYLSLNIKLYTLIMYNFLYVKKKRKEKRQRRKKVKRVRCDRRGSSRGVDVRHVRRLSLDLGRWKPRAKSQGIWEDPGS